MKTAQLSIIAATAALALSAPASAQTDGTVADTTTTRTVEREDNDFPWGLLGLLGLAGLIPRKSKDTVTVDNRTRP